MKRALFLTLALAAALAGAAPARALTQGGTPPSQTPPDRITLDEFKALLADGKPVLVLDVRGGVTQKIKGAVNIPLGELESRLGEIPRDREIVTYCA